MRESCLYRVNAQPLLLHSKRLVAGTHLYSTMADETTQNRFASAHAANNAQSVGEISELRLPSISQRPFRKTMQLKYVSPRLKRDKKELQRNRMRELEKYRQWGYIRHQYPKSDLAAVQKEFNWWKSKMDLIGRSSKATAAVDNDQGRWLYELGDTSAMRKAWEAKSIDERRDQWAKSMLATLRWCPSKASMLLEATLDPLPPGYAIHDVLRFIAQNLRLDSIRNRRSRSAMADEVLATLAKILDGVPKGHVPFSQSTFGLFAQKLPAEQTLDLYDLLRRLEYNLHKNTLLHFAGKLAGEPAHKTAAYEILKAMVESGATLNDAASGSTVTTLLHCKAVTDGWSQQVESFSAKDALELFMEHGYTPNTITLTAVLDSLCQHGRVDEAIRLALLFAESGVALDAKTWTTVFAGAKASLSVENVTKALLVAKVTPASFESVLSNALHAIFYFADMETRSQKLKRPWSVPMFRPMLKIYAKKFELKSLQWWLPDSLPLMLGDEGVDAVTDDKFRDPRNRDWDFARTILPVVDQLFSAGADSGEKKLQPNSTADGVMLRAYIRSLSQPRDILAFYKFFRSRLEERSKYPTLLLQNQGAMIHDAFIMAMLEHKELWREALKVFGDMLKDSLIAKSPTILEEAPSPQIAESGDEIVDPGTAGDKLLAVPNGQMVPAHPQPTVFTLTILLQGLLYQGEAALADQMMQVMREFDIEPNVVTWNTLIRHHAMAQNTRLTVTLLQDMEAAGLKPDMHTYNAFNKLRDQDKALQMMQSIVDQNHRSIVAGDQLY